LAGRGGDASPLFTRAQSATSITDTSAVVVVGFAMGPFSPSGNGVYFRQWNEIALPLGRRVPGISGMGSTLFGRLMDAVKVRILGTGMSVPSLRRLSASYLVNARGGNILIDVGPSVVRRLLEFGWTVDDIDIIALTHFHPDHVVDLSTFLFACNYGEKERRKPLLLLGGRGLRRFHRRMVRLYPSIMPNRYDLSLKTLPRGSWLKNGVSFLTAPMNHKEESIAIRIEEGGKSVVFSGDSDESPALADLAQDADLLVVECSSPERKMRGHLDLRTLLPIVRHANPTRVVLTHLSPEWETYAAALPAPLVLGEDGMEIDL